MINQQIFRVSWFPDKPSFPIDCITIPDSTFAHGWVETLSTTNIFFLAKMGPEQLHNVKIIVTYVFFVAAYQRFAPMFLFS
jgi:hypothetical protein